MAKCMNDVTLIQTFVTIKISILYLSTYCYTYYNASRKIIQKVEIMKRIEILFASLPIRLNNGIYVFELLNYNK